MLTLVGENNFSCLLFPHIFQITKMVKIFIGNLAKDDGAVVISGRDLKPLFDNYGTVTECVVLETKGYG